MSTKIISSKEKNYSLKKTEIPKFQNLDCMLTHHFLGTENNRKRVILVQIYNYNVYLNVVNHAISTEIFHENRPLQRRKNKIPPWAELGQAQLKL